MTTLSEIEEILSEWYNDRFTPTEYAKLYAEIEKKNEQCMNDYMSDYMSDYIRKDEVED